MGPVIPHSFASRLSQADALLAIRNQRHAPRNSTRADGAELIPCTSMVGFHRTDQAEGIGR